MPYVGVNIGEVLEELGRIRDCVSAARALAEAHTLRQYHADDLRDACESLLVNARFHMIEPLIDYLDSCYVADANPD